MEQLNDRTVYIVYNDKRKDFKDAERFGNLKEIYSSVGRAYNSDALIEQARRVLDDWKSGDMILMVGDPALCAIAVSVALEYDEYGMVDILRWNRFDMRYEPLECDFSFKGENEQN